MSRCVIDLDDVLWCWGTEWPESEREAASENPYLPEVEIGLPTVADIAAGVATCAVTLSGDVWCWGDNTLLPVTQFRGNLNSPAEGQAEGPGYFVGLGFLAPSVGGLSGVVERSSA